MRRHLFWCASMCAEWSARTQQLGDVYLERKLGGNHQFGGHICHFCFQNMCGSLCRSKPRHVGLVVMQNRLFFFLICWRALVLFFLLCVFACAPLSCLTWLGCVVPYRGASPSPEYLSLFSGGGGGKSNIPFHSARSLPTKRRRSSL